MENRAELGDLIGGQVELEKAQELRVTVLLDDVDALMRGNEVVNLR